MEALFSTKEEEDENSLKEKEHIMNKRNEIREKLLKGELENEVIEIEVEDNYNSTIELFSGFGMEEYNINMEDIFGDFFYLRKLRRKRLP